jgi:hypothetical protein
VGLVRFASAERCFHDEHAPTGDDQGKLANVAELADAQDLGFASHPDPRRCLWVEDSHSHSFREAAPVLGSSWICFGLVTIGGTRDLGSPTGPTPQGYPFRSEYRPEAGTRKFLKSSFGFPG